MGRTKFVLDNTPRNIYAAEIIKEGERAVDISKIQVPSNLPLNNNDELLFLHDLIDLDDLIACYNFADNVLDESGNYIDGSSQGTRYDLNDNRIGKAINFDPDSLRDGLVGWWKFNGNLADSIGKKVPTLVGTETYVTGISGKAFDFNGSTYLDFPKSSDLDITDELTMSAWVYIDSAVTHEMGILQYGACNECYSMAVQPTAGKLWVRAIVSSTTYTVFSTKTRPEFADQWVHIAGTFDGSKLKIYINGEFDGEVDAVGTIDTSASDGLEIGRLSTTCANWIYEGAIEDVKIFNKAKNAEQIRKLYQPLIEVSDDNLSRKVKGHIAHIDFNKRVTDRVNNNNGTWTGTAAYVNGKHEKAGDFNGSSYVTLDNDQNFDFDHDDPFSIALWIKTTASSGSDMIITKGSVSSGDGWELWRWNTNGYLTMSFTNGGVNHNVEFSGDIVNDGIWHFVVITYDGSSNRSGYKMYFDGVLSGSGASQALTSLLNDNPVRIGADSAGGNIFNGQIDECRIFNKAISQADVTRLFTRDLDFGTGQFSVFARVKLFSNPYMFEQLTEGTTKDIWGGSAIGSRIGINVDAGNIQIGNKLRDVVLALKKVGTPTGILAVGVVDSSDNLKAEERIDVSTLTTSTVDYNFRFDEVTLAQDDKIFVEYAGGTMTDYVQVDGHTSGVPSGFSVYSDHPWASLASFMPRMICGNTNGALQHIASKRDTATNGWRLGCRSDGRINFKIMNTVLDSTLPYTDGQYHTIYVERGAAGALSLRVDDVEVATGTETGNVDTFEILRIGSHFNNLDRWAGSISDLRIYDRPLTTAERNTLNTKNLPVHVLWFGGTVWKTEKDIKVKKGDVRSFGKEIGEVEVRGEVFTDTSPEAVVKSLVNANTNLTYVDDGKPSGNVISRYVADGKLLEIISDMARVTGRVWRADARKNFFFVEESVNTPAITYTHGLNARLFETTADDTELVNDLVVLGENKRYSTQEAFNGDASTKVFTLTNKPVSTRVVVDGVDESAEIDFTVDIELRTVTFAVAPASGTNNVVITYEYEIPLYIRQVRQSSIDEHGRRAKRLVLPWIKEYADGVKFISAYLNVFSKVNTRMEVEVPTFEHRLNENDVVTLVNAVKNVNTTFLVKGERWIWPKMVTVLQCGEFGFDEYESKKQVLEKIHDLETALTSVKDINEYEAAEETLVITDVLAIGLVEEFSETLVITDAFDIEVVFQGVYGDGVTVYSGGTGASDNFVYTTSSGT